VDNVTVEFGTVEQAPLSLDLTRAPAVCCTVPFEQTYGVWTAAPWVRPSGPTHLSR